MVVAFTIGSLLFHGLSLFGFAGIPTTGPGALRGRYGVNDFVYEVLLT
jgi:hypothetical protein